MKNNIITAALESDVPLMLWAAPGTGKSSMLENIAKTLGYHLEILVGSTIDPTDISGIPYLSTQGQVSVAPPDWAQRIKHALNLGKKAILFLDELSCAQPSQQAALLRVIQSREVAGLNLQGCRMVAAANRADTAASNGDISPATANRFAHVEHEIDVEAWAVGLAGGVWENHLPRLHPDHGAPGKISSFLRRHSKELLVQPDEGDVAGPWPSPRSWTNAARLAACGAGLEGITACVGEKASAQYASWITELDLPDPIDLLEGRASVPSRGDRAAAALASMVSYISSRPEIEKESAARKGWSILGSVRPDCALSAAKSLLAAVPAAESAPEALSLGKRILGVK